MLHGICALDLTDEKSWLCGRILTDCGADVIKVEPPGGDPGRNKGPFFNDEVHPELSIAWFAYNLGKKGITLNLEYEEGKQIFKTLVKKVDLIIESYSPGHLEEVGLASSTLRKINPSIIVTSITPFGQSGPYSRLEGPDIVVMAMGGFMYVTGDTDRPPLRISFPIAYALASAQAALGSCVALYHQKQTGIGQDVDVSAQESVVNTLTNVAPTWELNKILTERVGPLFFRGGLGQGVHQRVVWPCKDGAVAFMAMGGKSGAASNRNLVIWMDEEGVANEFIRSLNWESFDTVTLSKDLLTKIEEPIGRFFQTHTKRELLVGAEERRVFLQPVMVPEEILADPQLVHRAFWVNLAHPLLEHEIKCAGPFAKSSEGNLKLRGRPPSIGEHNLEIYREKVGLRAEEIEDLKTKGVI